MADERRGTLPEIEFAAPDQEAGLNELQRECIVAVSHLKETVEYTSGLGELYRLKIEGCLDFFTAILNRFPSDLVEESQEGDDSLAIFQSRFNAIYALVLENINTIESIEEVRGIQALLKVISDQLSAPDQQDVERIASQGISAEMSLIEMAQKWELKMTDSLMLGKNHFKLEGVDLKSFVDSIDFSQVEAIDVNQSSIYTPIHCDWGTFFESHPEALEWQEAIFFVDSGHNSLVVFVMRDDDGRMSRLGAINLTPLLNAYYDGLKLQSKWYARLLPFELYEYLVRRAQSKRLPLRR